MFTKDPVSLAVTEQSQIGETRRVGVAMAEALGFDETSRGEIAIVLTELASNLVRHANGGEVLLRSLPPTECCGLEVLALDRGPGIIDVAAALRDGFSTRSSPGNGLGAVGRLSTTTDLYSVNGHGSAMMAHFRLPQAPPVADNVGWVCLPMPGETACGDACDVVDLGGGRTVAIVVDGLGHGLHAAEASRRAMQVFRENATLDSPQLFDLMHNALRTTRGAAISVADIRRGQHEVCYTGVGNVSGRLVEHGKVRGMVSHNGTVGAKIHRVQQFSYPWTPDTLLVMQSDGLASQWRPEQYPGLFNRHASLIAGVLYRDHRRTRDDVTVLALSGRGAA